MLPTVRAVAIAPIGRAARRLHVSGRPWPVAKAAQGGRGVKRAGTHLHIVGLQDRAAFPGPVILKPQDDLLKGFWRRDAV